LIERYRLGTVESARVLAFMNMALMDVSILCWRTKFKYWQMRPSQVDKTIVPSFPIPNFPSYPSGHAAFSAAAATFLGHRFPDERQELTRLAEEAAQSRVVSGLHYPFDCEAGLWQGRRVAETAIALYEKRSNESK
jgi:membrane-associated phospholipid phosphatase